MSPWGPRCLRQPQARAKDVRRTLLPALLRAILGRETRGHEGQAPEARSKTTDAPRLTEGARHAPQLLSCFRTGKEPFLNSHA